MLIYPTKSYRTLGLKQKTKKVDEMEGSAGPYIARQLTSNIEKGNYMFVSRLDRDKVLLKAFDSLW